MKRYHVTSVDYDIEDSDILGTRETASAVMARLPQEFTFEIDETEPYVMMLGADMILADMVTEETTWLVNGLKYEEVDSDE